MVLIEDSWAVMHAAAALFWGNLSLPRRKTQESGSCLPPFQSPWTAPILCLLSENPCLTVRMTEHKVCFKAECLLYLLYDHNGTIQKNFIQDLANFLSFSLSHPPSQTHC